VTSTPINLIYWNKQGAAYRWAEHTGADPSNFGKVGVAYIVECTRPGSYRILLMKNIHGLELFSWMEDQLGPVGKDWSIGRDLGSIVVNGDDNLLFWKLSWPNC